MGLAGRTASRRRQTDVTGELEQIDRLAGLLDTRLRIPFTPFRVGLDGMLGILPGVGDTLTLLPSAYIIARGWQLGARKRTLVKMMATSATDYLIGLVPLVGDLLDIGYKGNVRNAATLRREMASQGRLSSL